MWISSKNMLADRIDEIKLSSRQKEHEKKYINPKSELLEKEITTNLRFSFIRFKFDFINIENTFNNHFKDDISATLTMYNFLKSGLPLLETISVNEFLSGNIRKNLHCHKISNNKLDIVKEILNKFKFAKKYIDDVTAQGRMYQIEIPYEKGPVRMVGEIIGNNFYLLFFDTNHHIYFNKKKVKESGSMYFEFCPIAEDCSFLNGGTCLLDEFYQNDFNKTYGYNHKLKED